MFEWADNQWLLDVMASPIGLGLHDEPSDLIPDGHVSLDLTLAYVAAGRAWRNVPMIDRPQLCISLDGIYPLLRHWHDLEGQTFSQEEPSIYDPAHYADLTLEIMGLPDEDPPLLASDGMTIRFLRRHDLWFSVEIEADLVLSEYGSSHRQVRETCSSMSGEPLPPEPPFVEATLLHLFLELPLGIINVALPEQTEHPSLRAREEIRRRLGLGQFAWVREPHQYEWDLAARAEGKTTLPVLWHGSFHAGAHWFRYPRM